MTKSEDFASLFGSSASSKTQQQRSFTVGDRVEGTVVQIGHDFAFVDVGARSEARIERAELADVRGDLRYQLGDTLKAQVVAVDRNGQLTISFSLGKRGADLASLQAALEGKLPIAGVVTRAVNAGLEVDLGGVRGFCPASHVDRVKTSELAAYEGQTHDFRIIEIRDGGKSVVVSRRAVLEASQQEEAQRLLARLEPGIELEGTVTSLQKYGAFVDLGGIEGLVHISELGAGRVQQVSDVVHVGDKVNVRVLGIDSAGDQAKIKLTMRTSETRVEEPARGPSRSEVLQGNVTELANFGVFIDTEKGSGLIPTRELLLPHGADHRRAFPVGSQLTVVLLNRDPRSGKLTFSMKGVAEVEERRNFAEFAQGQPKTSPSDLGSFGELLRQKLDLGSFAKTAAQAPPATAPVQRQAAATQPVPRRSRPGRAR